jgi:hypothetical protein
VRIWRWCQRWPSTSSCSWATRRWARRPSSPASCTTSSTTPTRSVRPPTIFASHLPRPVCFQAGSLLLNLSSKSDSDLMGPCCRRRRRYIRSPVRDAGDDRDRLPVQDDVPRGPHRSPSALVCIYTQLFFNATMNPPRL